MHKLTRLTLFAFLIVIAGNSIGKNIKKKHTVNIKDVRKTQQPAPDVANHKHHDVEVYRTNKNESSYTVSFYIKSNDSVKYYEIRYGTNNDMDKATYNWVDDTLVAVRLFSSDSQVEKKLKASGSRSGTKMWVDE